MLILKVMCGWRLVAHPCDTQQDTQQGLAIESWRCAASGGSSINKAKNHTSAG